MKKFSDWMEDNYRSLAGEVRDSDWLAKERARLMKWPRDKLINWLVWNDPNGVWRDEDVRNELDSDPMTVEDAVDHIMNAVEENLETPEEMMKHSQANWPGRYKKDAFKGYF